MINEFKVELKNLLEKYEAYIYLSMDDCSDTHGISGEEIRVTLKDRTDHLLSCGYGVDKTDL